MKEEKSLKRILVPVDGSASSLMAEETGAKIAKKTGAVVTVLHVMQETTLDYTVPRSIQDELLGHIEQRSQDIINNARALFKEEKVEVDAETFSGNPANDILDFSKSGFDLIVMGACGEHEKDTCILGSVTKNVIRHTTCPTLVAKQVSSLSNMLVCTDGSEHALKALDFAAKLAEKMDSKIVLLHVQEEKLHKVSPKTAEDLGQKILAKTVRILGKRKSKIDRQLEFGVPANVIVDVAEKGNHDLIVLGRRGLGTIDRFLLGSVSDDVSHKAKCSVLIIPP